MDLPRVTRPTARAGRTDMSPLSRPSVADSAKGGWCYNYHRRPKRPKRYHRAPFMHSITDRRRQRAELTNSVKIISLLPTSRLLGSLFILVSPMPVMLQSQEKGTGWADGLIFKWATTGRGENNGENIGKKVGFVDDAQGRSTCSAMSVKQSGSQSRSGITRAEGRAPEGDSESPHCSTR